jgi:hypothetical protein
MLVGGLWFDEHKPVMETFLNPFEKTLSNLESEGMITSNWFSTNDITCIC